MITIWNKIFYYPIYNALIFLMGTVTFGDVGFAVILLTLAVKIVLFPLSQKSIKSQIVLKKIDPELKKIKKDFPDKQEQAKQTFALYKKYGVNPFSGCLLVLIQIPVIFGLYYAFYKGLALGNVPIYSFVHYPENANAMFLGLVDLHGKSLVFAILAGVTQFLQSYFMYPKKTKEEKEIEAKEPAKEKTFQDELSKSMTMNIKYILPVFIAVIAYQISAAVALYWITSNIATIAQEWYVRRKVNSQFELKKIGNKLVK